MNIGELDPLLAAATESRSFGFPIQVLNDYKTPLPLVVLSNRIPFSVEDSRIERSVSGLVSAVEAALQEGPPAVWLGWNGSFDNSDTWIYQVPRSSSTVVGMPISYDNLEKYYSRVCNSYLFPLYCGAPGRATEISDSDWLSYVHVNRMFAYEACRVADRGAIVWVNDFHLQLCPRLIKDMRPDLYVVFFQHIPFPSVELFRRIPWYAEILDGINGADRIGLQTSRDRENFLSYQTRPVIRDAGVSAGPEQSRSRTHSESSSILVAPAEIDTQWWRLRRRDPSVSEQAATLRKLLGYPGHVFLGVDRLEPTKGISEKIAAFIRLAHRREATMGSMALLQVAVASDPRSLHGGEAVWDNIRAELLTAEAPSNGEIAVYLAMATLSRDELAILYSVADTLVVTSFSEGMNLVVKEFVAFKGWDPVRLIISQFAGVAEDLPTDVLVNPHDLGQVAEAMHRARVGVHLRPDRGKTQNPRFLNTNSADWAHKLLGTFAKEL